MRAVEIIAALLREIDDYLASLALPETAEVRRGLARWKDGPIMPVEAHETAACAHLDAALAAASPHGLVAAIAAARPLLRWGGYDAYPADEIGEKFASNHAFASLIGEGAPLAAKDFDLGFFVIAPNVFYRDHHHAAPELYAPLTGPHGWRFRPGDPLAWKPAHQPVWNAPCTPHATMTGTTAFLSLYCWTRDVNNPARVIRSDDWPQLENTQ